MSELFPYTPAPWCSIIIPTLNEAQGLPDTLRAIGAGQDAGAFEVIVCDGGSTDGTLEIARSHGCSTLLCTRGRGPQMNAGAKAARAPHLWFVHADTLVPDTWPADLGAAIELALPATFKLRFDYRSPLSPLRLYGWLSRFDVDAFRFGDQSLFASAHDFMAVAGFDENMDLLEDNDLARRLRQRCGGLLLLPATVLTSARKYRRHGVVFTQSVFVGLYLAYRLGASNERLVNWYGRAFG